MLTIITSIPHDKQGHFIAGVLAYAVAHFAGPMVGLAVVIAMAVGKEIYDQMHRKNHTPEALDAVATILGGIAGYICGL